MRKKEKEIIYCPNCESMAVRKITNQSINQTMVVICLLTSWLVIPLLLLPFCMIGASTKKFDKGYRCVCNTCRYSWQVDKNTKK